MRVQDLISSKPVTRIGLFTGQHMPRWVGYRLARIVASLIARKKPQVYWTVQANLSQVLGLKDGDGKLHEMTRHVFFHAGQTYYDFFNAIGRAKESLAEAVRISSDTLAFIRSQIAQKQGILLLIAHMSNFDLVGLSVAARGLPIQVLSLANPEAGFHILNYLRGQSGLEVTPITPASLRAAVRRLKDGGLVATGVDRPVPGDRELIEFFGQPAYLPVGPVRLALMTEATVIMGSCHYEPDEGYILKATGPIQMTRSGDRRQDVLINARRLAVILEEFVRAHPEQWMMFHPVWPERLGA